MGSSIPDTPSILAVLLAARRNFNEEVRANEPGGDAQKEYWAKQYILGLVSECDEFLRLIEWEAHHKVTKAINRNNLAYSIVDLLNYVLSLAEHFDFGAGELLVHAQEKEAVISRKRQMTKNKPGENQPILMLDLDGSICAWREAFVEFLKYRGIHLPEDTAKSLQIDTDLELRYPEYALWKHVFEVEQGYLDSGIYTEVPYVLKEAFKDHYVVVTTARPADKIHRIWYDTITWLDNFKIRFDELHFVRSERLDLASTFVQNGHEVTMIEDEPDLALRAASIGIPVIMRAHPYNERAKHPKIARMQTFTSLRNRKHWTLTNDS